MDFEGFYLWDERYGRPKVGEDIEDFLEKLEDLPEAPNRNFQNFAEFLSAFAKQAFEFYPDPIIDEYKSFSLAGDVEALLKLDEAPYDMDVIEYFLAAIGKGAQDNQLIFYDSASGSLLMPSPGGGDDFYADWLEHLKKLQHSDTLPRREGPLATCMHKMFKERAKELGIKNVVPDPFGFFEVDFGKISISYFGVPVIEDKKVYVWPEIKIGIRWVLSGLEISYVNFHQIPYDWHAIRQIPTRGNSVKHSHLLVNNKPELQEIVDKSLAMIMFFYPHCSSLEDLYTFLTSQVDAPHLARNYVRGMEHINPEILCGLARLTHQPNYETLREKYLQQYIDNLQYGRYEWQRREALEKGESVEYQLDERLTNDYLEKTFNFKQEKLRFDTELIDTKKDIMEYLELACFLDQNLKVNKACLEILKISDIGTGPYFVVVGRIFDSAIDYAIREIPKGGKLLVIAPWENPEKQALIESLGGIYLNAEAFLE